MSSSTNVKTESTATFLTALWFNGAIFAAELLVFTFVRRKFVAVYEPRTSTRERNKDIDNDKDYTPTLYSRLFSWPWHVIMLDIQPIKHLNGLDAYFFVRFLSMMCYILLPIWLVSWAVLLPVTSVHAETGRTGLDMFTFGNISRSHQSRYAAHIILVYLFTFWIWKNILTEMNCFVVERLQFITRERHRRSAQARTVLITGIEADYLSERALSELFSIYPGGVQKVWLNRDLGDLPAKYKERQQLCKKLEGAENKLIRLAVKQHKKLLKNGTDSEKLPTTLDALVPENKRPTFRLPAGFMPFSLPFIGEKKDTITWASERLRRVNYEMNERQAIAQQDISFVGGAVTGREGGIAGKFKDVTKKITGHSTGDGSEVRYPPLSSAFILFREQIAAHMCVQSLAHHAPYNMSQRYIEIAPSDIIWGNLGMNTMEMRIRTAISYGITAALIILWAIPVAFLGAVSNIANLCATYKWLAWICTLPKPVIGILQGVLPPALLAILNMLLPIFLRMLSRFEGTPTRSNVELSLMTRYFIFNVFNSFLVVTLSSGIIAALPELVKNPGSIPSLLATSLPQASNFFLTYVLLQGFSVAANSFLQIVGLVIYLAKLFFLGSTPRSLYNVKYILGSANWGTLFPVTTLVAVVVITYSIISPIINGLACATFYLTYLAYKYLFTYRLEQPRSSDTGGRFFPKAIQHLFVGLYLQQICLAALFFLARNASGKPSAVIEGALMIVLLVLTIFFHIIINDRYGPLIRYVPTTFLEGVPEHLKFEDSPAPSAGGVIRHNNSAPHHNFENVQGKDVQADPMAMGSDANESNVNGESRHFANGSTTSFGSRHSDSTESDDFKFAHPATKEQQPVIWIPRDHLGIWEGELKGMLESKPFVFDQKRTPETEKFDEPEDAVMSIRASTKDAIISEKGRVELSEDPEIPEESEMLESNYS